MVSLHLGSKYDNKLLPTNINILTPNQIEGRKLGGKVGGDRKRRGVTEDMVDGSCNKCGRHGKAKRGENGTWSKHSDRVDGKIKYCGQYFPLKKTGVLENY